MNSLNLLKVWSMFLLVFCTFMVQGQGQDYPVVYGNGTYDFYAKGSATFTDSDHIVIIGNSTSVSTAGEGFVLRANTAGAVFWTKLFNSGGTNNDFAEQVDTFGNDTFVAFMTITAGSAYNAHLLKFDNTGTISVNQRIGVQSDHTHSFLRIDGLVALSADYAISTFRADQYDFFCGKALTGAFNETLIGFIPGAGARMVSSVKDGNDDYQIIHLSGSTAYASIINGTNLDSSGVSVKGMRDQLGYQSFVWDTDYDPSDVSKSWTIIHARYAWSVYTFFVDFGGSGILEDSYSYLVTQFDFHAVYVSIDYISSTEYYAGAMTSAGTAVIMKHTGADGLGDGTDTIYTIRDQENLATVAVRFGSSFLRIVTSIPAGPEDSRTGSNLVIYATDEDLDFTPYTFLTPTTLSVQSVTLRPDDPAQVVTSRTYETATATPTAGDDTFISDSDEFLLKLELEDIDDYTSIQESGDTSDYISVNITNEQGLAFTADLVVDGGTPPSWMTYDSVDEEIDIDYTSMTRDDLGSYSVTFTITLDDFPTVTNSSTFEFIFGIRPEVYPFELNSAPDTTLGDDGSTCDTEEVYPLIYGNGTEDMHVLAAEGYSVSTDFLAGGKVMKSSTTSEGFLMRFAADGRIRWQKLYNSDDDNQESIIHVDTYESLSFAVAQSTASSVNSFYVISLDESGSLVENQRIGNFQGGYNFNTIYCVNFVMQDDSFMSATFQGGLRDFISFKNLSTTDDEFLIGVEGDNAVYMHFLTAVWAEDSLINAITVWNGTLYYLELNGVTTIGQNVRKELASLIVEDVSPVYDVDWSADRTYLWGAIEANPDTSIFDVYYFHADYTGGQLSTTSDMKLVGFSWNMGSIAYIDIVVVDEDTFVAAITDSNQDCYIQKLQHPATSDFEVFTSLAQSSKVNVFLSGDAQLMYAFSKVGAGNSSLTSAQIVFSKSDLSFDFSIFGCSPDTTGIFDISGINLNPTFVVEEWITNISEEQAISDGADGNYTDGEYILSHTTTYAHDNGTLCEPQPIVLSGVPDDERLCYDWTNNQEDDVHSMTLYQCQELLYTVSVTLDDDSTPDWIVVDEENDEFIVRLSNVDLTETGRNNVSVVVTLDNNSDINNTADFETYIFPEPDAHPVERGDLLSTTLETDDFNCTSENVFPLIFGDGTEDLLVADARAYSTSLDFLVGGQYVQNAGVGFLLRSSRAGIPRWQKLFNSDDANEDEVVKLDTFDSYSYAIVSTDASGTKTFHVVKLDTDGSILFNELVGNQNTYTFNTIECVHFFMQDEHFASMTFQADLHDFHSFKNLTRETEEFMIGFESIDASELYLLSAVWAPNDLIYAMAAWKTTLFAVNLNATTTCATTATQIGTRGNIHRNPTVYSFSYYYEPDELMYYYWGAIEVPTESSNDLLIVYNEYDGDTPHGDMYTYSVTGMTSKPISVTLHAFNYSVVYFTTMEASGKGTVYFIDEGTTNTISDFYFDHTFDTSSKLVVIGNANMMMFVTSMPAASDSTLTESQIVVFASDFDLDFSTYNCFGVTDSNSVTYDYEDADDILEFDWINVLREEADIVDGDNTTFTDASFGLTHTMNFDDGSGNQCLRQQIIFEDLPDEEDIECFDLTIHTDTQEYPFYVYQCQDLSLSFPVTLEDDSTPDWVTIDTDPTHKMNIVLANVDDTEEGKNIVNVTVHLEFDENVSNTTTFETDIYQEPGSYLKVQGAAESTTLETDTTTCTSNVLFPLIFGDGAEALIVTDSKGYTTSADFLVGGKYIQTSSAEQAFLLRSDRVGVVQWQKMFNSGASNIDTVEQLDTFEGNSYAVVSSDDTSTKVFHLIKLASDGTVSIMRRLNNQATYTLSNVNCVHFYMQNENFASVTFDADLYDFHLFVELDTTDKEYMIGFEDEDAAELVLMSAVMLPSDNIHAMAAWKTTLFSVELNTTTTCGDCKTQIGTRGIVHRTPAVFDFDYNYDGSYYSAWGAVQVADDDSTRDLLVVHVEYDDGDPLGDMKSYSIAGLSSKPSAVRVLYYDVNTAYVAIMESSGQGSIVKVDDSGAAVALIDYYLSTSFDPLSRLAVLSNNNGILIASSMPQASLSTATESQVIVYGADYDLDFSADTCFSISDSDSLTATAEDLESLDFTWINVLREEATQPAGDQTTLSTTSFELSQNMNFVDDDGDNCLRQPIFLDDLPKWEYLCYDLTANQADQVTSFSVSQCQSLDFSFDITLEDDSTPDWISIDQDDEEMTISLSSVDSTEEGKNNITILVDLTDNVNVANGTNFETNIYQEPASVFTSQGADESTTIDADDSTCLDDNVFPLIFGDGTEDLLVMDSSGYSVSYDFLVGGQYMQSSTSGLGYLIRSSRVGIIRWQKMFNSDDANIDKVEKVDTFNNFSYAVMSSEISGTKEFNIIKLDSDGSILENQRVGEQSDYTFNVIDCVHLFMQNEHFASMTFQADLYDFHAFKNLNTDSDEFMIGFEGDEADELYLMSAFWEVNDQIYAMAAWKTTLFSVKLDGTTTCGDCKTQIGTRGEIERNPSVFDFDYFYDTSTDQYSLWGAVQVSATSSVDLFVVQVSYDGGDTHGSMRSFTLTGMASKPINVSMHYNTSDIAYLATMESDGTGSVYLLDATSGMSVTNIYFADLFDGLSPLVVTANHYTLLVASSMEQASATTATESQMIVYGSGFDLDFTDTNCFAVTDTVVITAVELTTDDVLEFDWINVLREEATVTNGVNADYATSSFELSKTLNFLDAPAGETCLRQPILLEPFPVCMKHDLTNGNGTHEYTIDISQCQNLEYDFTFEITDYAADPAWVSADSDTNILSIDTTVLPAGDIDKDFNMTITATIGDVTNETTTETGFWNEPEIHPNSAGRSEQFLWGTEDTTCESDLVYPIVVGEGNDYSMNITDATGYGRTRDILIGGQSFNVSASGEGFLIRMSKVGQLRWQKIFNSGDANEDKVEKVQTYESASFAVVSSDTGTPKTFHLLKFDEDGVLQNNEVVGAAQSTYPVTFINCVSLLLMNDELVSITFHADLHDFHSFKNLETGEEEYMNGFESIEADELTLMSAIWIPADHLNYIAAWKTSLFFVRTNATAPCSTSETQIGMRGNVARTPAVFDFDWDITNYRVWGAVETEDPANDGDLLVMYAEAQTGDLPDSSLMKTYSLDGLTTPATSVNVLYIDQNTVYVATMEAGGQGTMFKITDSSGVTETNKYYASFDAVSPLFPIEGEDRIIFVSSVVAGTDAAATESQVLAVASDFDLDFSTFTCFEITDTQSVTLSSETAESLEFDWINVQRLTATLATGDDSYIVDNDFFLAETYNFKDVNDVQCTPPPIRMYGAPDFATYNLYNSDVNHTFLITFDQCQGLDNFTMTSNLEEMDDPPIWFDNLIDRNITIVGEIIDTEEMFEREINIYANLTNNDLVNVSKTIYLDLIYDEPPVVVPPPETNISNSVEAAEPTAAGVVTSASVGTSVAAGVVTGGGGSTAALGIAGCQNTNTMSMVNVEQTDTLYEYEKSFDTCSLSANFGDQFGLEGALDEETRRMLSPGYTSLTNLGFTHGSFIVNYCYFLAIFLLVVFIHLILIVINTTGCCCKGSKCHEICKKIQKVFEFTIYIYMMIFASMFIFILTLNEVAGPDFGTTFNIISFIISCVMLAFLVLMIIVPFIINVMFVQRWGFRKGMYQNPQTFCEKVCSSYWNGVKKKFLAMNYYSFALAKNLVVAVAFIFIEDGTSQIVLLVAVSSGMFFYVILIRPFESLLRNLLAVVNEAAMFLSMLIMIRFIDKDSDSNKNTTGYIVIGLTAVSLAIVLILGNISMILAVYSLCKTKARVRRAKTERRKAGDISGLKKDGNYDDEFAMSPKKYAKRQYKYDEDAKSESDLYMAYYKDKKQKSVANEPLPVTRVTGKGVEQKAEPTRPAENKRKGIVLLPVSPRKEEPKEPGTGKAFISKKKQPSEGLGSKLMSALPFMKSRPSDGTQPSKEEKEPTEPKNTEESRLKQEEPVELPARMAGEPVQTPYVTPSFDSGPGEMSDGQEEMPEEEEAEESSQEEQEPESEEEETEQEESKEQSMHESSKKESLQEESLQEESLQEESKEESVQEEEKQEPSEPSQHTPSRQTSRDNRSSISQMLGSEEPEESKEQTEGTEDDSSSSKNAKSVKSNRPAPVQVQNQEYYDKLAKLRNGP